jgi:hypothetical protein
VPFFHLEELWQSGWDENLKTVPPWKVTEAVFRLVKKFPEKRMIIHFLQPHPPFIGKKRVAKMPWQTLIQNEVYREIFWESYKCNLIVVMKEVNKLKRMLRGKVILTSDHGSLVGEFGIYLHMPHIRIEELVRVPWVVLKER